MMKKIMKATLCVAVLSMMLSCAKQTLEQPVEESTKKVEITVLKEYMAKLINVKVDDITYDEKSEQFSLFGIEQINRGQLTESYERSLK